MNGDVHSPFFFTEQIHLFKTPSLPQNLTLFPPFPQSYLRNQSMAFRFDKLTIKAQGRSPKRKAWRRLGQSADRAAASAGRAAQRDEGIVRPMLEKIDVDSQQLSKIVASELKHLPSISGGRQPQIAPALQKVFEAAADPQAAT